MVFIGLLIIACAGLLGSYFLDRHGQEWHAGLPSASPQECFSLGLCLLRTGQAETLLYEATLLTVTEQEQRLGSMHDEPWEPASSPMHRAGC